MYSYSVFILYLDIYKYNMHVCITICPYFTTNQKKSISNMSTIYIHLPPDIYIYIHIIIVIIIIVIIITSIITTNTNYYSYLLYIYILYIRKHGQRLGMWALGQGRRFNGLSRFWHWQEASC